MRILFAGDTHGNIGHTKNVFAHANRVNADIVFQLGDFGYGWAFDGSSDIFTAHVSKYARESKVPCYWLPGNHENYDALSELCNKLHILPDGTYEIASSVFYVPRGTVLTLGGVRFLCCGGGTSIDKQGRINGVSWWSQEAITEDDVTLCASRGDCDVLLSHDFPWECDIIDRHLAPHWGEEAQVSVIASRQKISRIATAAKVGRIYHGHLHIRYDEEIELDGRRVMVTGLNCDDNPMSESTLLVDTDDLLLEATANKLAIQQAIGGE